VESKAFRRGLGTSFRELSHQSTIEQSVSGVSWCHPQRLEPEFTAKNTVYKEVVYRLRRLAAQGAGIIVTQAVPE
jgi:hypothetical protein